MHIDREKWVKYVIVAEILLLVLIGSGCFRHLENREKEERVLPTAGNAAPAKEFVKWVDFDVSYEALQKSYELDVATYGEEVHLEWIPMLAYLAAGYGGDFTRYRPGDLDALAKQLTSKETTIEELTKESKYYPYYLEAYTAVLGGMVGEYEIEAVSDSTDKAAPEGPETPNGSAEKQAPQKEVQWEKKYGLKAFSPIAKGYAYSDYDDFGVSRSYGYRRQHLGHDMIGLVGTPIIAVESGYVEAIGWNQYGGWRLGIRSFDRKRYYYYAHLRQNFPYNKSLKEGSIVQAGDVIGYMGHTGYSSKENVNNIDTTHLHWGLQLIFDESQKEGNGEIWVDCYAISRFLSQNRSETWKDQQTKEYHRVRAFKDPAVPE